MMMNLLEMDSIYEHFPLRITFVYSLELRVHKCVDRFHN